MTLLITAEANTMATLSCVSRNDRKFDDYFLIQERLQAGAYGTVYRVIDKQCPMKEFAAKIVPRGNLEKIEEQDMIREACILRDICGVENVVEYVDFFAEDEHIYFVQGLAKGGDVFELIAKQQLYSEKDARSVATKLLQTIRKLHDRAILHRDIKLENLLLSNQHDKTNILLADFGFATYLPEEGYVTRRCGTPAYWAPEVWKRQPYGKGVDMWSLGCALYVLFSGEAPFTGNDLKETFHKACNAEVYFNGQMWKSVSEDAKECIRGLLHVDPNKRWTTEDALRCTWIQSGLTDALFQNMDCTPKFSEMIDITIHLESKRV